MKRIRTELRLLKTAVVVMTVGLIASLVIMRRAAHALADAHEALTANTAPTIVVLNQAQAQLRELHMLVMEEILGAPGDRAVRRSSIDATRRNLVRTIDSYCALPADPGELPLVQAVGGSLARVNIVVDRALEGAPEVKRGELGLEHDVDTAMGRLGLDVVRASEFSADLAKRSAAQVAGVYGMALPIAEGVEALTFLAAALTLALTYGAVRRAEALANRSLTSLERKAEELEGFAGTVAHDLLSPLTTVALALDLADRRLTRPEDAAIRRTVTRASVTLQRVRRFVSDLLDFARAGARPAPGARASLPDVVWEIADEFTPIAQDAGVDLCVEPALPNRVLACSPGALTSVLSNLVQNAIKYLESGAQRRVTIRALDCEDGVRVEVEDTGPGVSIEDSARLFEPYTRGHDAKAAGAGLGLATVKRLVESHGGHVGVRAARGHGSVFWFSLPVVTSLPG